jgi:hypothetical protein
MDMSARGTICMSSKDKKTLHCIPFFDSAINYDMMNKKHFTVDRELLNTRIHEYSEEGPTYIDIEN